VEKNKTRQKFSKCLCAILLVTKGQLKNQNKRVVSELLLQHLYDFSIIEENCTESSKTLSTGKRK